MLNIFVKKVLCPPKLQLARKLFGNAPIRILDVGCGNHSYEITHTWLNIKEYVGVDREYWHGDKDGYDGIDRMIIADLELNPTLPEIEENTFDFIIMNHVIKHLTNGEAVLTSLFCKLRPGGLIYIETPDIATLNYPSATGFMNFYDDKTHCRLYEIRSLVNEMMQIGFVINRFGRRRDLCRIALFSLPMLIFNLLFSLPFRKRFDGRGLWDLFGVASFVAAHKPSKSL